MNTNLTLSFPPVPASADKGILKPSAAFNKNVYRSIGAVILFVLIYLLLLLAVIGIAFAFGALGVTVMVANVSFLTLVLGVALIASGILLIYFVIKFLFKRNAVDHSGMIEVSEKDQPQLFRFIRQLTNEANAPFPKRIFLSADVNAAVFYDSSFWSMFLPVKKNLKIGLGLVNSLNVSEFKAVMAHEFGHFSQRSMKFGSYVYNMNKVIYNMLYDNEGYGKLLNSLSKLHSLFYLTAAVNIWIIRGIQFVLKKVYVVLNKTYMSLSREMEFHADAMAAYVSGSNHLITSLKRIEIGQICYNELLNYWSSQLSNDRRSDNFYPQHLEIIRVYSEKNKLQPDTDGLPVIANGTGIANASQLVINDQWSSHPSTEDREAHLLKLNLITKVVDEPAWVLFSTAEQLQTVLTNDVYSTTSASIKTFRVNFEDFKEEFYTDINKFSLDRFYGGYYDSRYINRFNVDEAVGAAANMSLKIAELLSEEHVTLPIAIERMQQDINTLENIIDVRKDIKTFDYKGERYNSNDAVKIIQIIEEEKQGAVKQMEELDKHIFIFFYNTAKNTADKETLVSKYKRMFNFQEDSIKDYDLYNNVMTYFNKVYTTMPFEKIMDNLDNVYRQEKKLKPRMLAILEDEQTRSYFSDEHVKAAENYLTANLIYFYEPNYDNNAIAAFNEGTGAYMSAIANRNFDAKKDLLSFQTAILNDN